MPAVGGVDEEEVALRVVLQDEEPDARVLRSGDSGGGDPRIAVEIGGDPEGNDALRRIVDPRPEELAGRGVLAHLDDVADNGVADDQQVARGVERVSPAGPIAGRVAPGLDDA